MQCGPAPLAAIKKGHIYIGYDTGFVFAEVNADRVEWIVKQEGNYKYIKGYVREFRLLAAGLHLFLAGLQPFTAGLQLFTAKIQLFTAEFQLFTARFYPARFYTARFYPENYC